jgi:glutamine amidotransferase
MRVVVADLGLGNLRSVERAIARAAAEDGAAEVRVTGDAATIRAADLLVFPGQGAFRDGAAALATEAGGAIAEHVRAGRPYFGICLGLQLLFEASDEAPGARGLGVFAGAVRRLGGPNLADVGDRKVPHMGWNVVHALRAGTPIAATAGEHFYFVHGYAAVPDDASLVAAEASYGARLTAAVHRGNVFAVQFHPEKSQAAGAALLRDVMVWAAATVSR